LAYQLGEKMALLDREPMGLLLRVFSSKPELVDQNVMQIVETIDKAMDLRIGGKRVFSRVDVLVSADTRYGDCDCGLTARALWDFYDDSHTGESRGDLRRHVFVSEVKHGDIFCALLNCGVALQLHHRVAYTMILSSGAKDYLTIENMQAMINALSSGARVTGLAITELTQSILEGRIANTCAIWHNQSLLTVGGFDLMARKGLVGEERPYAGVEEIAPLVRLIELYGACIAPVKPQGEDAKVWVNPDEATDPEGFARHERKMASKYTRQLTHATALGRNFEFIKSGVM
jgi:hypothetical protein